MKTLMITVAVVGLLAGESAAWAQAGQQGGYRGGQGGGQPQGQSQPQSQPQGQGSPDWNAYYKANPDLQRAYEANKSGYQANGESAEAFAARHYREHGQAEGRALPRSTVAQQPSNTFQGGQGQNQYQNQNQNQNRYQDQNQNRYQDQNPNRNQNRNQNQGGFGGRQNDQGSDRYQSRDRGGDWGRDRDRNSSDRSSNRNWQDWSRQWGDQNRSVQRRDGQYFDGRNWRSDRFNPRDYNRNFRAERRFRSAPYERPRGWYARRWSFGQVLPFAFFSRNYWITNYWAYDLPVPPYGCEWVRYGDDALLVDIESGEILQVIYGLYY